MELSIVIVNYRGWKHLEQCLNSLKFVRDDKSREVIVVDNNSNDGVLPGFKNRFSWVCFVLNGKNNGFSSGCNLGASHAGGEYILFLNPDVIANKPAVQGILHLLQTNDEIMLATCAQQNSKGTVKHSLNLFPNWLTFSGTSRAFYKMWNKKRLNKQKLFTQNIISPDWVSGSIMMMRMSDFQKIKGWSEDFWMYYEDVDLCKKISNTGGKIALSNQYSMEHSHGGTTRLNVKTSALTKAEVRISRHVYIKPHFSGLKAVLFHMQFFMVNLIGNFPLAALSFPFFFMSKLMQYRFMYGHITRYYVHAFRNKTWLSPRAPNFKK